ncbi:hypothetical protein [Aeromicrobium sp.]|uniref:hypothetical protein n=1 Tax=Aeromicrobium sp. TaxID=1871063 RepID=UPI0030C2D157
MRYRWLIALALVTATIVVAITLRDRTPLRSEQCVAEVGKVRAEVDLEQARWSALMSAISLRRGLPPRATTIAIATAFQESKIHNIDYGDRDSVGLFQQRPSQGWGTVEQISDPLYSIGRFYDALVRIDGYGSLKITDAAQRVQRSAYPAAYAQHEASARALASSLRGFSPAKFTCQINPRGNGTISRVVQSVEAAFGDVLVATEGSEASYPLTGRPADVKARGWAIAHYLVANASHLRITKISFSNREWSAPASDQGWTSRSGTDSDTVRVSTN